MGSDEMPTLGPSFRGLDPALLERLLERGRMRHPRPGECLFQSGQSYLEKVFVILRGEVCIQRSSGDDYRVGPGELLGLSSFLDQAPYSSTAVVADRVELLELDASDFRALKGDCPELSAMVDRTLAEKIRRWSPGRRGSPGGLVTPVRSVMTGPLAVCGLETPLADALVRMRTLGIGSLAVSDAEGRVRGLVTPGLLAEAVLLGGTTVGARVETLDCPEPVTIQGGAPLWQAERLQLERGVKHLVVLEGKEPAGMLSQTDLHKAFWLQAQQILPLRQTEAAGSPADLAALFDRLQDGAEEALENNRHASTAVRLLSENHRAIQRRCLELALEEVRQAGADPPAVPWVLLVMGSGGRREMLLDPDQDHGLIFADVEAGRLEQVSGWFREMGERFSRILEQVGYPRCPGGIMAGRPGFCKNLSAWKSQITHMARFPNEKAARWSNVVFDFGGLWGDEELVIDLRRHLLVELGERRRLLDFMMRDDAEGRPPIGIFNRLVTSGSGQVDLKRNGLRIIADAARIYALGAEIPACPTSERLRALARGGVLDADLVDGVLAAFDQLLGMLLEHQIRQRRRGESLDKLVEPDRLTPHAREGLRESLLAVKRLQDRLQTDFGRVPF